MSAVAVVLVVGLVAALVARDGDDEQSTTGSPAPSSTESTSPPVPDPSSSSVAGGTTPTTAPVGPDRLPLPRVVRAPRATGSAPSLALGPRLAIDGPSALADPPGAGPVLVTTLAGQVHAVDLSARTSRVVLDIRDRITSGGEQGLLGIAIDQARDRMYLDMTNRDGDTEVRSWALGADGLPVPGDGVLHLEIGQPFANHNGGNLVFGPDGALWIGTGDGGSGGDPMQVAQDPDALLGKMLRIVPNPDGGLVAPATNPRWGARPEVWGIGLRNPWRYSFDRATNRLWIADVGQNAVEEVSVIDPDAPKPNFGWDTVEGANDFEGSPSPDFTMPVVTYDHDHGCSITGGYVYRGDANPGLYGWYLYSDYCTGFVQAVPADDPTRDPVSLLTGVGSVISFGELDDGELVVMTTDGIRRLTPGS